MIHFHAKTSLSQQHSAAPLPLGGGYARLRNLLLRTPYSIPSISQRTCYGGFLFSPTEFETHPEVSLVEAVASGIADGQCFHEAAAIDVLACVRNRVVRRIRAVERFETKL